MKTIAELSAAINTNNKRKGLWDGYVSLAERLMLIVSELSEAMEADRKERFTTAFGKDEVILSVGSNQEFESAFQKYVKDTFEDELADAVIRIFDLAFHLGADLQWHIEQKMRYNEGREYKHGKKY